MTFDKQPRLHRLLTAAPRGQVVDHVNGDRFDNRKENLRVVAQRENVRNVAGPARTSTSAYLGVTYDKSRCRYKAQIRLGDTLLSLGRFDTPEEANLARLTKELELWGIQPRRLAAFQAAGLA